MFSKKYLLSIFFFSSLAMTIHGLCENNHKYHAVQLREKSITWVEMKDLENHPGAILVTDIDDSFITIVTGFLTKQRALVGLIKNDAQSILAKPIDDIIKDNETIIKEFLEGRNHSFESSYATIFNVRFPSLNDSDDDKLFGFGCAYYRHLHKHMMIKKTNHHAHYPKDRNEYDLLVPIKAGLAEEPHLFTSYRGK